MTQTTCGPIDTLRAAMTGQVTGPADLDYDQARRVWNADIDRRPAMIAKCASPADVAAAVTFAATNGMEITVRGGAHSMSGAAVADGGLMIDLNKLNQVSVDPQAKRARAGGGALLADLDAATQAHGLAVPAGVVSHTGVGGLTLGGGMGWLTRQAGLSIDNLASAQVVTADGQIQRAADDENPDLFWAIRGGGGNFGVVTEFEFRLHEVGPVVQVGLLFWGLEQGPSVLRLAREVIATLPRELNIIIAGLNAPPAPFVPEEHHHRPGYALAVAGFGSAGQHQQVMTRLREALPPLWEFTTPMPYVALQQILDEANAWGFRTYDKGTYLEDLSDEAIEVVTSHLPQKNSPLSVLLFYRLDQAYSQPGEDDTAFSGGRSPRFAAFIVAVCPTPDLLAADRAWARSFWQALRPHSLGVGSYVNAMTEFDDDRVRAAYGPAKYHRLAKIKAKYDPQNLFHHNANIQPA
jgi:FAD binding domain-containing protein/berberine-like enzyme